MKLRSKLGKSCSLYSSFNLPIYSQACTQKCAPYHGMILMLQNMNDMCYLLKMNWWNINHDHARDHYHIMTGSNDNHVYISVISLVWFVACSGDLSCREVTCSTATERIQNFAFHWLACCFVVQGLWWKSDSWGASSCSHVLEGYSWQRRNSRTHQQPFQRYRSIFNFVWSLLAIWMPFF